MVRRVRLFLCCLLTFSALQAWVSPSKPAIQPQSGSRVFSAAVLHARAGPSEQEKETQQLQASKSSADRSVSCSLATLVSQSAFWSFRFYWQ